MQMIKTRENLLTQFSVHFYGNLQLLIISFPSECLIVSRILFISLSNIPSIVLHKPYYILWKFIHCLWLSIPPLNP